MLFKIRNSSFFFITIVCALFAPLTFAEAAGSLSIQSLSPAGGTVGLPAPVSFTVVPSGFTSPMYTVVDDVGTNLSSYINAFGNFTWTPTTRDLGSRTLTITAQEGGNSASITQTISVIKPSATLGSMVNVSPAYVGMPMTFQITPVGFTNPSYWIGDSVGGSTLNNSKLNASGAFYWVPTLSDIGTHKILINVNDQAGHFAELTQDVTVGQTPTPQITSLSPGTSTPVGGTVTFSVTSPGYTSPTFAVHDSYSPSTVMSDAINSSGVFTWTPFASQIGTHNIRVTVTGNNGQSTDVVQQIIVLSPTLTIPDFATGATVPVDNPVKFSVVASGLKDPTYAMNDTFSGTLTNSNLSSSGLFVWTPSSGDIGLHNIAIRAVDAYGNAAAVHVDIRVSAAAPTLPPSSTPVAPTPAVTTPSAGASVPAASSGYYFTKGLAVGSSGAEVTALQQLLVKLGFLSATPNGTFGPMTAAAVKKFQSANGLSPVGSVGPGTRAKLNAQSGGASGVFRFTLPLSVGKTGNEVTELQKKLTKLGFYSGAVNGVFDAATMEAVKKFQAAKGLEQVGSVGPGTRAALNAI